MATDRLEYRSHRAKDPTRIFYKTRISRDRRYIYSATACRERNFLKVLLIARLNLPMTSFCLETTFNMTAGCPACIDLRATPVLAQKRGKSRACLLETTQTRGAVYAADDPA